MEWKKREERFEEILDPGEENKIIARFVFTEDYSNPESFAVIYAIKKGEQFVEVIRFDGDQKEEPNKHEFWLNPPKKRYLNKPLDWKTMDDCLYEIEKNWRLYRSRFLETKDL